MCVEGVTLGDGGEDDDDEPSDRAAAFFTKICDAANEGRPVLIGGPTPGVRLLFHTEERVSVKSTRALRESNGGYERTIIVSVDGPTTFARREAFEEYGAALQFFRYRDLIVNITHHVLVPQHTRSPLEAHDAADVNKYPHMLTSDPVAQYYDFQPGEVVAIRRTQGSINPFVYHRVVVAG